MTGFLTDFRGNEYMLPTLLGWDVSHGIGTPCDSFEVCFICDGSMRETLSDATRFRAEHEGETVFSGVVDEFEISVSENGMTATVRGRGMAALLLDNEAEAAEYYGASMDFILSRHVHPWGITDVRSAELTLPGLFTVASGSSQWRVLEDFAWFGGGYRPRFTREGTLLLNNEAGQELNITDCPVTRMRYTERRYGVISRMLVKNRSWGISSTVDNTAFISRGGSRRQVITMPRNSYYDALRHTGEYQIERSAEDSVACELTLPKLFAAFPGDSVSLEPIAEPQIPGIFTVARSRCFADGNGAGTILTLHRKG